MGKEGFCICLQHLTDLRAMIMVCRESSAKLSQGTGMLAVQGERRKRDHLQTGKPARQEDKAERTFSRD